MFAILYIGHSMVLVIRGLKNHRGEYVTDASVSVSLKKDGEEVFANNGDFVEGSNGNYDINIHAAIDGIAVGDYLTADVLIMKDGLVSPVTILVRVWRR